MLTTLLWPVGSAPMLVTRWAALAFLDAGGSWVAFLLSPLQAQARARSLLCFHVSPRFSGQAGSCVTPQGLLGRRAWTLGNTSGGDPSPAADRKELRFRSAERPV